MAGRVLLGLSGGADSCAAVVLLREQGYDLTGAVLDLSPSHGPAVEAAREAAGSLGIPLEVVEGRRLFDEEVVRPFCGSYRAGRTPNPCVLCNPAVKFRLLLETADRLGCEWIATGHYARVCRVDGEPVIRRAASAERDQSYMLYGLTREQRGRLLLPLGELPGKEAVRNIDRAHGLAAADAPDSQEICFIPDGDYPGYIRERLGPERPGRFISPEGKPCGVHDGLSRFTVGQRKGLGIALGRPVFVRSLDPATGDVFLADAGGEFAPAIRVSEERWQLPAPDRPVRVEVKVRSMARPAPATRYPDGLVVFDRPQRAPAPGQAAVYYREDLVLGGGVIDRWETSPEAPSAG